MSHQPGGTAAGTTEFAMDKITRRQTLAGLALAGAASCGLARPAAAAKKSYDLKPQKVADGIWMIEGATDYFTDENGGAIVNCVLIETGSGMVIVDSGPSLRYGLALREVAAALSPLGVAAVINTHHHPDHFFGNQVFRDKPIYALEATQKLAETDGEAFSTNMYRLLGDWMRGTEVTPPNTALTSSTVKIGGRELRILPLQGHTAADLALVDQKTGTLITGDIAFLDRAPTTPHANLENWQASIRDLGSRQFSGIIPGHGSFDTSGKSLEQTSAYLTWLDDALRKAAAEGLDMVEILATPIPEAFRSMGAMPYEFHRSVSHLFPGIERETMPVTNR